MMFPLFRDPRLAQPRFRVTLFFLHSNRPQDSDKQRLFCSASKINSHPANQNAYRSGGQTSAEKILNFTYHTAGVCSGTSTKPCANKALCANLWAKRWMETPSLTNRVAPRRLRVLRLLVWVTGTPVLLGVTGTPVLLGGARARQPPPLLDQHHGCTGCTSVSRKGKEGKCFMTFRNSISF